jgi:hypothetical protein
MPECPAHRGPRRDRAVDSDRDHLRGEGRTNASCRRAPEGARSTHVGLPAPLRRLCRTAAGARGPLSPRIRRRHGQGALTQPRCRLGPGSVTPASLRHLVVGRWAEVQSWGTPWEDTR